MGINKRYLVYPFFVVFVLFLNVAKLHFVATKLISID